MILFYICQSTSFLPPVLVDTHLVTKWMLFHWQKGRSRSGESMQGMVPLYYHSLEYWEVLNIKRILLYTVEGKSSKESIEDLKAGKTALPLSSSVKGRSIQLYIAQQLELSNACKNKPWHTSSEPKVFLLPSSNSVWVQFWRAAEK